MYKRIAIQDSYKSQTNSVKDRYLIGIVLFSIFREFNRPEHLERVFDKDWVVHETLHNS